MFEEEKNRPSTSLLIGGGIVFVLVLIVLFFTVARQPNLIAAPQTFKPYAAPDSSFACLAPTGWERRESSAQGIQSQVIFRKGNAKIAIVSDLQGSLMGDMARAAEAQTQSMMDQLPPGVRARLAASSPAATRPAVEQVHLQSQKALAMRFDTYQEMPMQTLRSSLGEARCSEWTAKQEGFLSGGKFHGYRVTILTNERRVTYVSQCPEESWKALRPAFGRILASLASVPTS